MNPALARIADRRANLIAQAAAQRLSLAQSIDPWRRRLAVADQVLTVLRFVRGHPAWVIGSLVLLSTRGRGRGMRWLQHSWLTLQIMKRLHRR